MNVSKSKVSRGHSAPFHSSATQGWRGLRLPKIHPRGAPSSPLTPHPTVGHGGRTRGTSFISSNGRFLLTLFLFPFMNGRVPGPLFPVHHPPASLPSCLSFIPFPIYFFNLCSFSRTSRYSLFPFLVVYFLSQFFIYVFLRTLLYIAGLLFFLPSTCTSFLSSFIFVLFLAYLLAVSLFSSSSFISFPSSLISSFSHVSARCKSSFSLIFISLSSSLICCFSYISTCQAFSLPYL